MYEAGDARDDAYYQNFKKSHVSKSYLARLVSQYRDIIRINLDSASKTRLARILQLASIVLYVV